MKQHYIAVLVPQLTGEWRAYLPAFPNCRATGTTPWRPSTGGVGRMDTGIGS